MHIITTQDLIVRTPQHTDVAAFKAFEKRNKEHFAQFTPSYELSDKKFQELITLWVTDSQQGKAIRFFIFDKHDKTNIIGSCNFTNIIRGPFQACYLGYKMDFAYCGQGLMTQALQGAIDYMFNQLNMHRIMANYIPENHRSAKLLQRLGFTIEGTAKEYLYINHSWEDHVLTALINPTWQTY